MADEIGTLATDQTAVARAFRRFYEPTRDELLSASPWTFARRYFALAGQAGTGTVTVTGGNTLTFSVTQDGTLGVGDTVKIGTAEYVVTARTSGTVWTTTGANVGASAFTVIKASIANPTEDWRKAWRLPSRVLIVRRLVDGNRTPIRTNWPVFATGSDASGRLLYTDVERPTIEYTESITDVTVFPPYFSAALAAILAFKVSPLVTNGDPSQLGTRALQVGQAFLADAMATDLNQRQPDDDPTPDLLQYRSGAYYGYRRSDLI